MPALARLAVPLLAAALALPAAAEDPAGEFGSARVPKFEKSGPPQPSASPAQAASPADAVPRAIERVELPRHQPAQVRSRIHGKPALYARHAMGPRGYDPDELAEDLRHTSRNLDMLLDYLRPYEQGATPPSGEDAAWARRLLAQEGAAGDKLIAEGDAALARGIPRVQPARRGSIPPLLAHISRPTIVYRDPTPEQREETIASLQSNVLGHLGALIAQKRLNPPVADEEVQSENQLARARLDLERRREGTAAR